MSKKGAEIFNISDFQSPFINKAAQDPLYQAQQLIYDAWETDDYEVRAELAKQALEISKDCADAYTILAEQSTSFTKRIQLLKKALAAGKRAIGKEAFKDFEGHFWGHLETRPFMRAKYQLAETLWEKGDDSEAIKHLLEMIKLNPSDNQGVRYALLSWLLANDLTDKAKEVLDMFDTDCDTQLMYNKVLYLIKIDNTKLALQTLKKANNENPYVIDYITGKRKLPELLPYGYTLGSEEEAICYFEAAQYAWLNDRSAVQWVKKQSL